jgi:hypothetical protein
MTREQAGPGRQPQPYPDPQPGGEERKAPQHDSAGGGSGSKRKPIIVRNSQPPRKITPRRGQPTRTK